MDDLQQRRSAGTQIVDSRRVAHRFLVPLISNMLLLSSLAGCRTNEDLRFDPDYANFQAYVQEIEYPQVCELSCPPQDLFEGSRPPSARNIEELESWPLTLEEAIELTLQNSEVIRDLDGVMRTAAPSAGTVYGPALQETNPISGVERALSAFDAQFAASMMMNQDERKFNNAIGELLQGGRNNNNDFRAEIWKVAPTGSRFTIRNLTDYVRNNARLADPDNPNSFGQAFASVSETLFQAEARHPLLRGSGVEVNRIAGPNARPGVYDGILLSRINTDISLAQFELHVRNLLRDVEMAYWELLFAYYNLDSIKDARHFTAQVWRNQQERVRTGKGRPDDEAQARQQYYAVQAEVENALSGGSLDDATSGRNGLYTQERALRRLMGLPPTDGRLIRPVSRPAPAPVQFDWENSLQHALSRRIELRMRKWEVRRRELELIAARNMLLPQLDLVAHYGFRGFGDELFGQSNSAFADLFGGDLQEWQVGMEFAVPIGNRIGHIAERNAKLRLARERALLREQEQYIAHDLAEAFTDLDRAFVLTQSTYNSRVAAMEERDAKQLRYLVTEGPFFLLDAQQRLTRSEIAFYRAVIDYNKALLDIQYSRGTMLNQMQVYLAEGPWSDLAHYSAARQSRRFQDGGAIGHVRQDTAPVSAGAYDQQPDAYDQQPVPAEMMPHDATP